MFSFLGSRGLLIPPLSDEQQNQQPHELLKRVEALEDNLKRLRQSLNKSEE